MKNRIHLNRRKDYTGIKKICEYCRKEYTDVPNRRLKYCSMECVALVKKQNYECNFCGKGYVTTSTRNIKYCSRSCAYKGSIGRIVPDWVGEKISLAKLKHGIPSDGIRIRKQTRFLKCRTTVLKRDGFTCQICFEAGLDTHHIKSIKSHPELAYDVNNLIVLCKKCHDSKVSKHEEEWEKYFSPILKNR